MFNYSTKGFVKEMTNNEPGAYVILGLAGAGKTALAKEYIQNTPENLRIGVVTTEPREFEAFKKPSFIDPDTYVDQGLAAFKQRPNILIDDSCYVYKNWNSFIASFTMNTVITAHANSIVDFISRFRQLPEMKNGARSVLESIKGITYSFIHRGDDGERCIISESVKLNPKLMRTLLVSDGKEIQKIITKTMIEQGQAPLSLQVNPDTFTDFVLG